MQKCKWFCFHVIHRKNYCCIQHKTQNQTLRSEEEEQSSCFANHISWNWILPCLSKKWNLAMNLKDKGVQFLTYDIWIASFKTQKKISKTFQFLKEASLNFAENCKSISNSLTPKIALRLCIPSLIPIKHLFQQADRKHVLWSSLSVNMQNMIN